MASPQLTADQIAEVSGLVAGYIEAQREKALPSRCSAESGAESRYGWLLPAASARYHAGERLIDHLSTVR